MEGLLRMRRGREFQVVGAATAKLREPKHVWTCGTANKLQSDERSLRDGTSLRQYRVKIGRLSSRDSFVSDAGNLKLNATLDRQPM